MNTDETRIRAKTEFTAENAETAEKTGEFKATGVLTLPAFLSANSPISAVNTLHPPLQSPP
jgi:hypothetical protein